MAAQTEAPDDLIAELARLMADDAKSSPASEPARPVRIPGEPSVAPGPRFDFSASSNLTSSRAPTSPVRIPGAETPRVEPEAATKPAEDPFVFNFDFTPSGSTAAPATAEPEPMPAPAAVANSTTFAPAAPPVTRQETPQADQAPGPLDQDSLADLIAAELAADLGPDLSANTPAQPVAPTPEPDRFGVPPVFGLGSPSTSAPVLPPRQPIQAAVPEVSQQSEPVPARDESEPVDPLEEIERLVGSAVRLNVAAAEPTPAPALRSLATPVALEPAIPEPQRREPQMDAAPVSRAPEKAADITSVDQAILAAAAATGAHVEWVNDGARETEPPAEDFEPIVAPARASGFRMNRAVAGPLVAVGLLAMAGFGLYWVLGQGGTTTGPAPLLVADTTPTKEVPEVDTTASQQSVVFNEISGANTGADEQIVSRDQADTEAVVAANAPLSGTGVISDADGTTVDPNQDGLVNRKVRTVTVRPDGTIVSGDDSMAGSAILPVDRPNVPEVPGADFSTPDLIASVTAEAEAAAAAPVEPAVPATPPVVPGSSVAVVDAAGSPLAGRSVTIPMQRPSDFSTLAAAALASANTAQPLAPPSAATTPIATAPAPQATASVGNAAAYVQMASQRSEAEAQATVQAITTRYGVLFGGATPQIQRADLGERGIYYRVLVPAASREAAANICTNVKAAGGDCLLL